MTMRAAKQVAADGGKPLQGVLWLSVLLLAVLPVGALLLTAAAHPGVMLAVFSDAATVQAAGHSLYTSLAGTLVALVLGCVFAFAVAVTDVRGKRWLVFAFMVPMMIPPQVTALAWLQLSGPASPLLNMLGMAPPLGSAQPMYSANGIALLLGVQGAPLVFLSLRAQLLHIPQELIEASQASGAGYYRVLRDMVLPLSRAGLVSGASLAFISSLGNFGIAAMLGIPAGYYTLPTLMYQKMAGFGTTVLVEIASLAVCIGGMTLMGIVVQQFLLKRHAYGLLGQSRMALRMALGRARLPLEAALWALLFAILVVPLLALLGASLVPAAGMPLSWQTLSVQAYAEILWRQQSTLRAFSNSFFLSAGAALLLMLLALGAVQALRFAGKGSRMALLTLIDLPYALPGVVLAIACVLLFVKPLPLVNIHLYATIWLIFIAYLMRFFAVAMKPVHAAAGQLSPALEQAAQLAGANVWQRMRDIFLPLLAPSMAAGGILVFLTAVNELTVSALLWSAGNETLGVMVYNLEEGGSSILASALSVLIVVMVVVLMGVLALLAPRLPRGVIPWQECA